MLSFCLFDVLSNYTVYIDGWHFVPLIVFVIVFSLSSILLILAF